MKTYAYYPGCSAKASTRELGLAAAWLARRVGIELVELADAGCCGSCEIKAMDPELHFMLNARILSLAAQRDLEILTVCDTCQANLLHTSRHLDGDGQERVRIVRKLEDAGVRYGRTPRVRHFVTVLSEEFGMEALAGKVVKPLSGLRVAPFACCHAFRGPGATPGSRDTLDGMVALSGATAVPARTDGDCCGFHVLMANRDLSARAAGKFMKRCAEMSVDCVVTTSPLCHTALDIYQRNIEAVAGRPLGIPVLHVEQLLALAFGCAPREVGLERHLVSTGGLLRKLAA